MIEKLLFNNLKLFKITISIIVIFFIVSYNLVDLLFFKNSVNQIIFNVISSIIIVALLLLFLFYIINRSQAQSNTQIEQLTEAYQYIGQINRKIDSILDLDISSLDQSINFPIQKKAEDIFHQLIPLVNSIAGILYFKPPFDFKIHSKFKDEKAALELEKLLPKDLKKFKYSQNPEYKQRFIKHGLSEDFFKKYEIISKPVYMHDQDIGLMLLVFNKGNPITDRDLNIIRVFSFYLALNATFKPDFSLYKA